MGEKKEKKRLKKVINVIEYIIVFTVIIANAILIFKSVYNPNKSPSLFGKKAFVIISGSMKPKIDIGDIVFINEGEDVKPGDVIAFRRDSNVIVHRVVKELDVNGETMYQTKGDNNNVEDKELVRKSTIEGVYFGKISYIGKFLMFLYNHLTMVIIILVAILIVKFFLTRYKTTNFWKK